MASFKLRKKNPIERVGGLSFHIDPSDRNTITITTGVSQADDKSFTQTNLVQATGTNQPAYVTEVQGNKAALRFDGVDNFMSHNNILSGEPEFNMIVVASMGAALQSTQKGFLGGRTDGSNLDATLMNPSIRSYKMQLDNTNLTFNDTESLFATDEARISVGSHDAGTTTIFFSNGRLDSHSFTEGNSANVIANWGVANLISGGLPIAGFYADCDIFEIAYFPRLLSTSERKSIETHLANKFGIALQ